jgi:carbon storage regulator
MLVLARKIGQRILIGDGIVITVKDINRERGEVRIGLEAPRDVPVFREELVRSEVARGPAETGREPPPRWPVGPASPAGPFWASGEVASGRRLCRKHTREGIMDIDAEKVIEHALRDAIREGIKARIADRYDSPLAKWLTESVTAQALKFRKLLDDAVGSCLSDADFTASIAAAVRSTLAKTLVQQFGGQLERQVNTLKSDPVTRARIVLAIEEIVEQQAAEAASRQPLKT